MKKKEIKGDKTCDSYKGNIKVLINNIRLFFYKHCIRPFYEYPILFYFIITALFNTLLLRILTVGNFLYFKPLLADLAMLFIFSSFMFLIKSDKGKKKYLVVLSFVVTILCLINSMYYTYYSSFVSVSLLTTATFIVEVGDAVVEQVLDVSDLVYLWQPIFILYYYFRDKNRKMNLLTSQKEGKKIKNKRNKSFFVDTLVSGGCLLVFMALFVTKTEWSRFGKMWNRESVLSSFGVITYQINDICQSLEPKINNLFGHDSALKNVVSFYENKENNVSTNMYTGVFEGMNVIVIHAESLQTITLESSFNGVPVAPTFKRLADEGIYFDNYYSPVGVGTSSDAEFMFSTSLMPSSNGTVFVNYFDREYSSIQKAFKDKGYYTFSMHGNTADFWNRATMHKNLGYDDFYSKTSFDIDETIGLGISDKSFFKQAIPMLSDIIKDKDKPFYGTLITLTNHTPWNDLELLDEYDTTWTVEIDGELVVRDYLNDTTLGRYFRNVHYMDQALDQFLTDLDAAGILDNTVVVIYGDHDARINKKEYNFMYNYDPYTDAVRKDGDDGYIDYNEYEYKLDKNVPFIIWTKNNTINKKISTPTSTLDAFPMLANLFGLSNNKYQLGHDILGNDMRDNTVVFNDGSYITSKIYYNGQNSEIYSIDGSAVDEAYIKDNAVYAGNIIDVSNDIITYDLIKEIEKKESLTNGS